MLYTGKIVVGGIDYDTLKDRHIPLLRRKIGVVFQDFKLLPQRTVFENIAFALEIAGMTNREIKSTVPKVIELVGLVGKEKQFPHQLSGGERHPKHSWDIVRLFEKINKYGTTVLLTTHNVDIVNKLKRRVITIEHGKIVSDQLQGSYRQ